MTKKNKWELWKKTPTDTPVPSQTLPDAAQVGFLNFLPYRWQLYARLARLDRPIGWWLLLLPTWWSEALAARFAGDLPHLTTLFVVFIGAIAMRGAGSTWNDWLDRKIDAKVERTKNRPLASGELSSLQAFLFLFFQLMVGLGAFLSLHSTAQLVCLASLLPVAIYPLMKRISNYPQFVLGLTFAWGALVGFADHTNALPLPAWLLYVGAIMWVIGYDTIYAQQDMEDDILIGIGSTALAFGRWIRFFTALFYFLSVVFIGCALFFSHSGLWGWGGQVAFAGQLGWQVSKLSSQLKFSPLVLFRSNRDAGLWLFLGLMLDVCLR